MSILPLPLLRRRSLLPGESLPSLLMRLAKVNHYAPLSLVIGLALGRDTKKGFYSDISRFLSPTILERLTALTKLDPFVLYSSTYHRLAPITTPPEIAIGALKLADDTYVPLFTGKIAQFQLRPGFAVQFCPKCLRSLTYHRLIWVPIAVSACLEHKCLLINRCPHCGRPIRMRDIFETCCSRCQVSLVEAQPIDVLDDEFGLFSQQVIQSWLVGDGASHPNTYLLPEEPTRVLYRFIDGLRMALMKVKPDWLYLHRLPITMQATASMREMKPQALTPYQSYCLYATALKAIINWPQGFYNFLDAYRGEAPRGKHSTQAVGDLGSLYSWLELRWQHSAFAFVQEAFNQFFLENYALKHEIIKSSRYKKNRELVKLFAYMSVKEAARLLHTSAEMIKFLVQIGRLTKHESQDAHKFLRLDRSEILALQASWLDSISLAAAAELMGAPQKVIPSMVRLGLIQAEPGPSEGILKWRINKSSVVDLMNTLAERCLNIEKNTSSMMDFSTASRFYAGRSGLDSMNLLLQARKGLIRIYYKKDQPIQIRSLFFDRLDIQESLTAFFAENGWVDKKEAIRLLRTSHISLTQWVNSGLILMQKYKISNVYDKKSIEEFLANHVRTKDAANILGVTVRDIYVLARAGLLKAVSGPSIDGYSYHIFRRETILQWKNDWLTYKEAAKLLEVTEDSLFDFAKRGLVLALKPRYGSTLQSKVRSWYSRQSILDIKEKMKIEKV